MIEVPVRVTTRVFIKYREFKDRK